MAGFAATFSGLSKNIVDRVYDPQVRYQPNLHLQPHEEDGALSTQPHKSTKVWQQQKVFHYNKNPQERVREKVLAKVVPGKDGREQIVETTKWPYSMLVKLSMLFKGQIYGGSGALVGPHHILTCGHNVYDIDENVWAEEITVYPALNGNHAPFGSVKVVKVFTFNQYTHQKDERYDIALLILNKSIGKYTGWAGMLSAPDDQLFQEKVNIVGYPGDKGMTQMWGMKHTIHQIKPEQFEYLIDTNGGQSGSAIWISKFGAIMILGVHTTGGPSTNSGVRLSKEKFEALIQKIAESYEREKPQSLVQQPVVQAPFVPNRPQPNPLPTFSKQPSPQPAPARTRITPRWQAPAPTPLVFQPSLQPALPPTAFGKAKWAQYFGDVGEEPPLPPNIEQILSEDCPFWPGNKIRDTHLLVLIPETVNGETLTVEELGELIKKPKEGHPMEYNHEEDCLMNLSSGKSHWVLMTKWVIPGTQGKFEWDYNRHLRSRGNYQMPTVLEAATCILMDHVMTGTKWYPSNPYTCARCEEDIGKIVIGGFDDKGINMGYYPIEEHIGLAALRPLISSNTVPKASSAAKKALPTSNFSTPEPMDLSITPSKTLKSEIPLITFGKAKWARYFGDVGIEPPLPPNLHEILNASCPFWPGKRVQETHLLTLIPRTVNGKPFTLNSLGELIQKPQGGGKATKYYDCWDEVQKEYGNIAPAASYWVLMTKDVIPESRNKKYDAQKQLLTTYNQKSHLSYEVPRLLESATGILMEHVQSGTRLYSDSPLIYTRCQERVSSNPYYLLEVGCFAAGGLNVIINDGDESKYDGVGGCRKF